MEKSFKVLLIATLFFAPLACSQQNGSDLDLAEVGNPTVAETEKPNLKAVPQSPTLGIDQTKIAVEVSHLPSQAQAEAMMNGLFNVAGIEECFAALSSAGYPYHNAPEFLAAIKSGTFPSEHAGARLVKFFALLDPEFDGKVEDLRDAQDSGGQVDIYYAKTFANVRLMQLLDIVYRQDVTSWDAAREFRIGDLQYTWTLMTNGILVSYSNAGE